jgi:hypothetical protein
LRQKHTHEITATLADDYGKQLPVGTKATQTEDWREHESGKPAAKFRAKGQDVLLFQDEVKPL